MVVMLLLERNFININVAVRMSASLYSYTCYTKRYTQLVANQRGIFTNTTSNLYASYINK
jgi:hypothetical protein